MAPQQWNDLVAGVPCVTVGEPRGTEQGEQIISPQSWRPRPPQSYHQPSTGRPGQGEEQHPALENATPIKLRRLGSRSAESGVVVLWRRIHTQHSRDSSAPQIWTLRKKKNPERIFITNVSIFTKYIFLKK